MIKNTSMSQWQWLVSDLWLTFRGCQTGFGSDSDSDYMFNPQQPNSQKLVEVIQIQFRYITNDNNDNSTMTTRTRTCLKQIDSVTNWSMRHSGGNLVSAQGVLWSQRWRERQEETAHFGSKEGLPWEERLHNPKGEPGWEEPFILL